MGFNSGLVIILQISLDTTEIKVLSNHCPPHTAQTQILKPNSGYCMLKNTLFSATMGVSRVGFENLGLSSVPLKTLISVVSREICKIMTNPLLKPIFSEDLGQEPCMVLKKHPLLVYIKK